LTEETNILIAGAGIAGLTTALALAQRGIDVAVADAFEEPSEVGAGLQIAPNASVILSSLGVLAPLTERAITPSAIRLGDAPSGRILLDMPITPAWIERMGAPYVTAHRAALHGVLYQAAREHPAITIHTGHAVADTRESGEHVTTVLRSEDSETVMISRIVIGADGIWSKIRESVRGAPRPQSTGRIAWRAIAPTDSDAKCVTAWMMPHGHLVTYPVRNADTLNVVAITRGRSREGDWAQQADAGPLGELLGNARTIDGFGAIEKANWTTWPLNAVDPAGSWHSARVLLIGDAAHGMEPFAAQGAAMAIEDGFAAGICIAEEPDDPAKAFARYTSMRRDRIARVAKRTEFNRWVYHQSGPGRIARNLYFSMRKPEAFFADLDWLYGYRIAA
jgi:salicylate hydroxylase